MILHDRTDKATMIVTFNMNAKSTAPTYLSDEEEWSKDTLLEILKVSTTNSDLSGR